MLLNIWVTFARNFVPKNLQKSPNLVALYVIDNFTLEWLYLAMASVSLLAALVVHTAAVSTFPTGFTTTPPSPYPPASHVRAPESVGSVHLNLSCNTFWPLITCSDRYLSKDACLSSEQCDQMARSFFNILPLQPWNFGQYLRKNCQSRFKMLPNTNQP